MPTLGSVSRAQTRGAEGSTPRSAVESLASDIKRIINACPASERQKADWHSEVKAIEESIEQTTDEETGHLKTYITLAGITGSGKSTLINVLLGADIVPTNEGKSCTSALVEIGYDPSLYSATVEFISKDEWKDELKRLVEIMESEDSDATEAQADPHNSKQIIKAKLRELYKITTKDDNKLMKAATDESEIDRIFDNLPDERSISAETISMEFSIFLQQNAGAMETTLKNGVKRNLWPIVKIVRVRGKFDFLRGGLRIVDAPGQLDSNVARGQVGSEVLRNSHFILYVNPASRPPLMSELEKVVGKRNVQQAMHINQVLILAATRIDEFMVDKHLVYDHREQFVETSEDKKEAQRIVDAICSGIMANRTSEMENTFKKWFIPRRKAIITKLWSAVFGAQHQEEPTQTKPLHILTISAAGFRDQPNSLISVADTGIPELKSLLSCAAQGRQTLVLKGIFEIFSRIHRSVFEYIAVDSPLESTVSVEDLTKTVDRAFTGLERSFREALRGDGGSLINPNRELPRVGGRVAYNTYRATATRGGIFGDANWPQDLEKLVVTSEIESAWNDLFATLYRVIGSTIQQSRRLSVNMGNSLIFELENLNVDTTALEDVVHHMESATWWRVSEAARIANKIDLEQRSALEKPIIHINSSLEPLCYNATFQHGKGMYEKMKNIMVQGVSQSNMFDKGTGEVIAILDNAREAMESELAAFCEGETRRLRMAVGPLLEGSDRPKIPYEVQQTILSRLEKFSKALGDMERKYSLDAEGDGDATEGALVARSA